MLFTVEQLHEIKEIIKDYHDAFIVNAVSDKALPEEIVKRLRAKGLIDPQVSSIQDAYLYGQILAALETKQVADMSYPEFKAYVKKNPVPLTVAEKQAVQMAVLHAGQYCQGLGNKVGAAVGNDLIEADSKLRARLETDIRTATAENIVKRETVKQLKTDLGWKTKDWARDWDRIAVTEKQTAMQEGVADGIRKEHGGEAWVSKLVQPGACPHCLRLNVGPDGHPRIFRLSTLENNGTNFGKKAIDWLSCVGTIHPNCQCTIVHVPNGWGYDEEGDLVPGGKGGKHYEDEKAVTKALRAEENLQKAIQNNSKIVFQGFPITIEQPVGSTRTWRTSEGETGETRFKIAYGFINHTQGMDGDEIDVFVGPDPSAENVYVIEQRNRNTGTYDEAKAMMGFANEHEAELAYRNHYDNPDEFILSIQEMDLDHFRRWVDNTSPKKGEMGKADVRFVLPVEDSLLKAGKVGGKYLRRVPYTDKNGKRRYRYFYAESAIARDVKAGETIRLGGDLITVEKVEPNGTVHLRSRDQTLVVKGHQWGTFISEFYGQAYYKWAEKRAMQSVNAVLNHVPRELLGELHGATDKARLADLKKRVPDVYAKLQKSFSRAGVNPYRAKEVIGASLERRNWAVEARAAVIGDVITNRNQNYRTTIQAAENLAGGKIVKLGHVAAVTEISRELRAPEPVPKPEPDKPPKKRKKQVRKKSQGERRKDPIAEVATKAEKEIAKLSALLEQARGSGTAEDAAQTLATALSSTAIQKLLMIAKAFPGLADKAVEPAKEIMLQVPSVATTSEPKDTGSSTTVYVAGEAGQAKGLSATYKLMESGDVIASHDPRSFNRRSDYPEGIQERAYHRDKLEQAKVVRNAQRMAPQFVVNTNPDAVNGPPIMGKDGVVLGGNSRTMSMQLVYANHPEKASQLRKYLIEHAHEAGFSAEDVKEFKNPILVRVIDEGGQTKEDKQLLVRQMNETFTQSMDPRTMQVAMGRKLTDAAISDLGNAMNPDETLAKFLISNRADKFLTAIGKAGIIDQRNANQYLAPKTGKLNADGQTLIARILVGRMINDADLLSATKPSIVTNLAGTIPFMVQATAEGKGYDLGADVNVALDAYNQLQGQVDSGQRSAMKPDMPAKIFSELFAQKELSVVADEHPVVKNTRAMGLLEVLIRRPGPQQIAKLFKDYAAVAAENPETQMGLLAAARTPTEVFNEVVQRHLKSTGPKKAKPPETPEQETAASLFKSVERSLVLRQPSFALDNLRKAGPFIGPRGGKWADAKMTIPWGMSMGEGGDKDHLKGLVQSLAERYGVKLAVSSRGNVISLDKIIVGKESRGKGVGGAIMSALSRYADKYDRIIALTPTTDFGGSKGRLSKFYKQNGFIENKGKNKDYKISESMYRLPVKDTLQKGGPFYGPRGGKWADSAHTIPWKEVKKPFLSTLILAEEAHEELNPFVSDWVFRNDGKAKTKLFEHYQKLDKATKQALDTETKYIINKIHGSDYVTVYRSMRPGDTDIGGMSASTDKATRSGNDVRAFKVHHSDVLLHWGQEASWLSSKTYRHEKELILKKDAKPVPMDTNLKKAGGPFIGPRGGKWADSAHTIPWGEEKKKPVRKQMSFDFSAEKPKPKEKESSGLYAYGMRNRPPQIGAVPNYEYKVKEHKDFRHGVIIYNKPLTKDEIKSYELTPLLGKKEIDSRIDKVVSKLNEYRDDYLEDLEDDPKFAKQIIRQAWSDLGPAHVDDLDKVVSDVINKFKGPVEDKSIDIVVHEKVGAGGRDPLKYFITDEREDKVKLSRFADSDYGPWVPKESLKHLKNDLEGKVDLPKSGRSDIDAVITGKAQFLGKGDDGLAFKVGDKIVKVSTTVPYQPDNAGHLTPKQAIERLKKQVEVSNELSDIKGIQRSEFVVHGDKGFQIKDWVEIPKKFTREQLDEIQKTVAEVHKRGYAIKDDIQAGLDTQGNPVLFDVGKAGKQSNNTGVYSDEYGDIDNLKRLYRDSGEAFVKLGVSDAMRYWQEFEGSIDSFVHGPGGSGDFARHRLKRIVTMREKEIRAQHKGKDLEKELRHLRFETKSLELEIKHSEKHATKSLVKAGPFIGPKGGKWADPQFTIPWKEGAGPRTKKQEDVPKPKRTPVGEPAKKQRQGKDEAPKPKKAAPGSQLGEETLKKLVDLKCSKLPQADIPADKIKVDFSGDVNSHALVVWPDSKGAIQSGYTPAFHEKNAKEKWDRITKFREKVPEVMKTFEDKLNTAEHGSMEHQGALVGAIIAHTGLRPGSEKSAKKHEHYGVVTLRTEHVEVNGDSVNFDFIGKSGKRNTATIQNATIAKSMEKYLKGKKEGESIFQSDRVVKTAGKAMPKGMKLKDMRTIKATQTAAKLLDAVPLPPPLTGNKSKDKLLLARAIKEVSERVAEVLNNTPAIARESYIHPEVIMYWALNKAHADRSLLEEV